MSLENGLNYKLAWYYLEIGLHYHVCNTNNPCLLVEINLLRIRGKCIL
jgi:hypothetical protein